MQQKFFKREAQQQRTASNHIKEFFFSLSLSKILFNVFLVLSSFTFTFFMLDILHTERESE
jgi:hypothetical protein